MAGWPRREDIYHRLDEAFDELRTRMGGLPSPFEAEGVWTTIWLKEAHHSTAIEGNTLSLHQTHWDSPGSAPLARGMVLC